MTILVNCPDCTRQLRLPQETLGATVRCPLCKSTFLTRPRGDGAEAIRVAPRAGAEPPPPPAAPPRPGGPPLSLDLDEPRPAAPPPLPDPATYDIVLDALPPDEPDDRPRRRARRDDDEDDRPRHRPPPPPRRDREDDEEDEGEGAPPRRRRSGEVFATFRLFVLDDPNERLSGAFHAEVGPDGLAMWRGQGRVIEVPVGAAVERTGRGRLRLLVEGRHVEVSVLDPEELHDELAGQLADFLSGQSDSVEPPKRTAGPVVWAALAPLAVPVLALLFGHGIAGVGGMVAWVLLGAALGGVCLPIVMQRKWSPGGRLFGSLGVSSIGLGILLIALAFDSGPPPPSLLEAPWRPFAPVNSGYRVEMPGHPAGYKTTRFVMPGGVGNVYELDLPAYGTWLFVGHGDPFGGAFQQPPGDMLNQARNDLLSRYMGASIQSESAVTVGNSQGKELHVRTADGHEVVARLVAVQGRLIVAMAVTNRLRPGGPEVRKFLDSLALDATTGWPGTRVGAVGPEVKPPERKVDELAEGGKIVYTPEKAVAWAGFSKDGKTFVAVTVNGEIVRFDAGGAVLGRGAVDPVEEEISAVALSPDAKSLYLGSNKGRWWAFEPVEMRGGVRITGGRPPLHAIAVSADGKTIASNGAFGRVDACGPRGGGLPPYTPGGTAMATALAFSDDGRLFASGDANGAVWLFDGETRERQAELRGHEVRQSVKSIAFTRDSRTLVTVGDDHTARLWDVPAKQERHKLSLGAPLQAVAFHPTGRLFATGGSDGEVRVFETATGRERSSSLRRTRFGTKPDEKLIRHLSFNADGTRLLVALSKRVEIWELERRVVLNADDRKPLPVLPRNLTRLGAGQSGPWPVGPMAVRPDGSLLAVSGRNGQLRMFDPATLTEKHSRIVGPTRALAVHPREGLAACGAGSSVHLCDTEGGGGPALPSNFQDVHALAFSPDGSRLAVGHSGGASSALRIFDTKARSVLVTATQAGAVSGVAFSPDGVALVTASDGDALLRLWEAHTGRECARLRGHTAAALCVSYSPDGKWIASGGKDKSARLWGAANGRVAFTLTGHDGAVTCLAFAPDGKTLATGGDDKTVRLWDVPSGKWLYTQKCEDIVTGVGFGARGETLLVRTADGSLDRWGLGDIAELKKRPEPVTPDYEKAAAPVVPDLQPATPIVPHMAIVIAPKQGVALAFTRDRLVFRYSYPGFELKSVSWVGLGVYKAVLDAERGLVYAAVSDIRKLKRDTVTHLVSGEGDLAILDVKALLAGQDAPRVAAAATVPIAAKVGAMELSADGKWLTYVDMKHGGREVAGRVDTTARKPAGAALALAGVHLRGLASSADGQRLYIFGIRGVQGASKGLFIPLDAATGKLGQEVETTVLPYHAVLAGRHAVATPVLGGGLHFVDLATGKDRHWSMSDARRALASTDGRRVYSYPRYGGRDVVSYDLPKDLPDATPAVTARFEETRPAYNSAEWVMAPDGQALVAPTGRVLRLAEAGVMMPRPAAAAARPAGKLPELVPYGGHGNRVVAVAYAPDHKWMLSVSSDREIVARRRDGTTLWARDAVMGEPYAAAIAPDGEGSAVMTWSGRGGAYRSQRFFLRHGLTSLATGLDTVAFTDDSTRLLIAGERGLQNSGLSNGADVLIETPQLTGIAAADNAPPAAGDLDGNIRLFDLAASKVKQTFKAHDSEVRCVAYSADGKYLASGGLDGKVKVWLADGKLLHSFDAHGHAVLCLAFAPDGKTLASGAGDGSLKLFDAAAGKEKVALPPRPQRPIFCLAFAPDGKVLAGGGGPQVTRWDTSGHVEALLKPVPIDDPPKPPAGAASPNW